jgi:hypothetical protein
MGWTCNNDLIFGLYEAMEEQISAGIQPLVLYRIGKHGYQDEWLPFAKSQRYRW